MNTYSIVYAGTARTAPKSYYRSLASAKRDADAIAAEGRATNVRVVECATVADAKSADIGDTYPVVYHA